MKVSDKSVFGKGEDVYATFYTDTYTDEAALLQKASVTAKEEKIISLKDACVMDVDVRRAGGKFENK